MVDHGTMASCYDKGKSCILKAVYTNFLLNIQSQLEMLTLIEVTSIEDI